MIRGNLQKLCLFSAVCLLLASCANRNPDNFSRDTSFHGGADYFARHYAGEIHPQAIQMGPKHTVLIIDEALGKRIKDKSILFCQSGTRRDLFIKGSFQEKSISVCDEAVTIATRTSYLTTTLADGRKFYLFHVDNLTKINVAAPGPKYLAATGPLDKRTFNEKVSGVPRGDDRVLRIQEDTFEVALNANSVALIDTGDIAGQRQTVEALKSQIPALSGRQIAVATPMRLSCERSSKGAYGFKTRGALCNLEPRT